MERSTTQSYSTLGDGVYVRKVSRNVRVNIIDTHHATFEKLNHRRVRYCIQIYYFCVVIPTSPFSHKRTTTMIPFTHRSTFSYNNFHTNTTNHFRRLARPSNRQVRPTISRGALHKYSPKIRFNCVEVHDICGRGLQAQELLSWSRLVEEYSRQRATSVRLPGN